MNANAARPALATRARSADAGPGELASQTAQRIVDDVAARGWPVGEVLGSEQDLLEQYGVSRGVLREAVRILEHQDVAQMRRGPGGGLVVHTPSATAVTEASVIYSFYVGVRVDEVFEARTILERAATELAARRLTDDDVVELRRLAEDEDAFRADARSLHRVIAAQSKNPALALFIEILNDLTARFTRDIDLLSERDLQRSFQAHAGIVEAMLAGDAGRAGHRMERHLDAEADFVRKRRMTRQSLGAEEALGAGVGAKRAEAISRAIFRDVVARGWPVGDSLGSESELMVQFDASRAVFREAIRLLEHHQIATMRRGRRGGLFVTKPGVETIADTAAIYLEHVGITAEDLAEIRMLVELTVVELATDRIDDDGRARLVDTLERESAAHGSDSFSAAAHDIHATLAELSRNRALGLIARVLIRLTEFHQGETGHDERSVRNMPDQVQQAHRRIVDAVVAGDAAVARARMHRHLDALAAWLN